MQNKICLITGANSGIGKMTALGLAKLGATVVMHARDPQKGAAAQDEVKAKSGNPNIHLLLADLESQAAIRQLTGEFGSKFERLDVLINNAASIPAQRLLTAEGIEVQFAVNHLAYFLLTHLLLDKLKPSSYARIINVSSVIHGGFALDFDNLQGEKSYTMFGWRHYSHTKLMNVMFTYELARRLAGSNVTVNCLHPGGVRTGLARHTPFKPMKWLMMMSPEKGAQNSLYLASSPEVEGVTSGYFVNKRAVPSSPQSYDEAAAARLWQISAEMTGVG